jgi:hypothetical protein
MNRCALSNWWYPEDDGEPEMEAVLAEINGWYTDSAAKR